MTVLGRNQAGEEIEANGWDLDIGRYITGAAADVAEAGLG